MNILQLEIYCLDQNQAFITYREGKVTLNSKLAIMCSTIIVFLDSFETKENNSFDFYKKQVTQSKCHSKSSDLKDPIA